ncbi:PHP domain-containing protein [Bacillus suaedae]|uniref:PHP domain-containing protein n=1 Tax=Halalkalibacter suaedae TaxID=2822140 RepID=A0A940WVY5_9BACI|nr:PHP domain-containing protein [Bacillus suaedae]MBP3952703.1 PHP domain-containing protein [Bacillus suaedae]
MIDLHCHTAISDNSFTIEQVIQMAKQNGIKHLAITDHDTTVGLERAIQIGKELAVNIIPGIEISAYDYKRGRRAHILGLNIIPGHEAITKLCQPLIERRHQASFQMVQKLRENGYTLTWEEVEHLASGGTGVYKQHIMHVLLNKGYTDRIYGELYKKLFAKGTNIENQGLAYVSIDYIDVYDAIRVIKEAGGVAVLAHPGQFNNFEAVSEWTKEGLEGIEVKHPLHTKIDEEKALALAEQYNLVKTGGSDFHGFYSDTGSDVGSVTIAEAWLEELMVRQEKTQRI